MSAQLSFMTHIWKQGCESAEFVAQNDKDNLHTRLLALNLVALR